MAGPIGFNLTINGNTNVPTFTLTNQSTTAQITDYSVTIGNTDFNFDGVTAQSFTTGSGTATLVTPDASDSGGIRADLIDFNFTGFDAGEVFQHNGDVDVDNSNTIQDYRTTMFNNGAALNSVITVGFIDDGIVGELVLEMPDDTNGVQPSYTFSARGNIDTGQGGGTVPEPGALALFGIGLLGLGVAARRRRKNV